MDGCCRQNGQDASLGFMQVTHHTFGGTNDLLDQAFVVGYGKNRASEVLGRRVKIIQRRHNRQVFSQRLTFAYASDACAEQYSRSADAGFLPGI